MARSGLALAVTLLYALAAPVGSADGSPARVLVVTVANGFVHESIPNLVAVIEDLGGETGLYTVERAETDDALESKTTVAALQAFDAVVLANTSSDLPFADREAFLAWVEAGGGVVGIHGASTLEGWPGFTALLGGRFDYHGEQATVDVRVEDAGHPATRGLSSPFRVHDEIYLYQGFDRTRVHMLLSLDRHPNTGEPGYFPWSWTRTEGKGRVFHTGAGHRVDVVESDWFRAHLLGGLRWVLGD